MSTSGMRARRAAVALAALAVAAAPTVAAAETAALPDRLVVALARDFPPFSFIDDAGDLAGARVEAWRAFAAHNHVEVTLVARPFADAIRAIRTGEAQVIDGMAKTADRDAAFLFSEPYHPIEMRLFYRDNIAGIVDAPSARGFTIGVGAGGRCAEHLVDAGVRTLQFFYTARAMIDAAAAGRVNVFCLHEPTGNYLLNRASLAASFRSSPPLYRVPGHWAVPRGGDELHAAVARGFAAIPRERFDKIHDRWFGAPLGPWPLPVTSRQLWLGGGVAGGVILAALAWLATLRAEVRRQTAARRRVEADLRERIKEQTCLQRVVDATDDTHKPIAAMLREVAAVLPSGFRFPHLAAARVAVDREVHDAIADAPVTASLAAEVVVDGHARGNITLAYTAAVDDGAPFLDQERALLEHVARRLGDRLNRRFARHRLEESERRFRRLFDRVPVAVWEEDIAGVVDRLDMLRAEGVVDLRAHLEAHPELVDAAIAAIEVVDVNEACLELYGAPDRETLVAHMAALLFVEDTRRAMADALVALFEGRRVFAGTLPRRTLDGRRLTLLVRHHFPEAGGTRSIITETDVTAEVDLRERYRLVTQATSDMIWEHDLRTDAFWWSEGMRTTFGHDPKRAAPNSASFLALVHPEDHPTLRREMEAGARGEGFERFVAFRLRRGDGRYAHVEVHAIIMRDAEGRPQRVIGSAKDVTERKIAEERFRLVAKGTTDVLFEHHLPSDRFWWSHGLVRVFGHDPAILARGLAGFKALIHPDDVADVDRSVADWLRDPRGRWAASYRLRRGDGSWARVEARAFAMLDAEGRPERIIGSLVDVTARVRAEERFRVVTDVITDLLWDHDVAAGTVWWGDGAHEVSGHEIRGLQHDWESWMRLIHPDDVERVRQTYAEALASGRSEWSCDYRLRHAEGHDVHVSDRCRILRDDEGRAVRAIGAVVDQTETLKLRDRLRLAERLEAMGQLTGAVAHDFNNILAVVMGNAELLVDRLEAGDDRAMAETVLSAAERGERLTRQLLSFARKQPRRVDRVDLGEIVRGMADMLEVFLAKRVELVIEVAPALPAVAIDRPLFENALVNLVVNARDAMPDGGRLTIDVRAVELDPADAAPHPDAEPGPHVVVSVADTGVGMDAATLARVFEPFFTTKPAGRGTGLGLPMVYGFVRQSGGHLRTYSEPGMGTVVRLYLAAADAEAAVTAVPDAGAPDALEGVRVLLVDDDPPVREQAVRLLENLGCRVVPASGGAQALELVANGPRFDVVLSDVVMPGGIDGTALRARLAERHPELPVVLMTGFAPGAAEADGAGGAPVLQKPFRRREVAAELARVLAVDAS